MPRHPFEAQYRGRDPYDEGLNTADTRDFSEYDDPRDRRPKEDNRDHVYYGEAPQIGTFDEIDAKDLLRKNLQDALTFKHELLNNAPDYKPNDITQALRNVNNIIEKIQKMTDAIETAEKVRALEDSITDALHECGEQRLTERFLSIFKVKLQTYQKAVKAAT